MSAFEESFARRWRKHVSLAVSGVVAAKSECFTDHREYFTGKPWSPAELQRAVARAVEQEEIALRQLVDVARKEAADQIELKRCGAQYFCPYSDENEQQVVDQLEVGITRLLSAALEGLDGKAPERLTGTTSAQFFRNEYRKAWDLFNAQSGKTADESHDAAERPGPEAKLTHTDPPPKVGWWHQCLYGTRADIAKCLRIAKTETLKSIHGQRLWLQEESRYKARVWLKSDEKIEVAIKTGEAKGIRCDRGPSSDIELHREP